MPTSEIGVLRPSEKLAVPVRGSLDDVRRGEQIAVGCDHHGTAPAGRLAATGAAGDLQVGDARGHTLGHVDDRARVGVERRLGRGVVFHLHRSVEVDGELARLGARGAR